jgi:inner membrane protein
MATLYTHAAAGLGIARLATARPMPWPYWVAAAGLPCIPDLDVFSTAAYGSPMGHRGITHSLVFALATGAVAAGLLYRRFGFRWCHLAGLYFVIVASHGLLDAMTWGGEAIPFFWPFGGRCGNWGPIPVSDIAFELPNPRTSRSIRAELLWVWLPVLLLVAASEGLRRWKRKTAARRNLV